MKLKRPDINTEEYWSNNYRKGERGGWWKGSKPLGGIDNFFTKEIICFMTCHSPNQTKLIEIGSGTGLGGTRILNDFPNLKVYNSDISTYAINIGKEKYPEIEHICWDSNTDSSKLNLNETFDFLIAQEVLEHLKNPISSLEYMMKLLKIGGMAFIATPYQEGMSGGAEHIQTFSYNDIPSLCYKFTDEVTVCNFQPIGVNLHMGIKFRKTK